MGTFEGGGFRFSAGPGSVYTVGLDVPTHHPGIVYHVVGYDLDGGELFRMPVGPNGTVRTPDCATLRVEMAGGRSWFGAMEGER